MYLVEICFGRVTHYYFRLAQSYLEEVEKPNQVKVSNRSSPEKVKYPQKRYEIFLLFAANLDKTNTNTESKSDKYRKKQKCEQQVAWLEPLGVNGRWLCLVTQLLHSSLLYQKTHKNTQIQIQIQIQQVAKIKFSLI